MVTGILSLQAIVNLGVERTDNLNFWCILFICLLSKQLFSYPNLDVLPKPSPWTVQKLGPRDPASVQFSADTIITLDLIPAPLDIYQLELCLAL